MADVILWNKQLTANDVTELYASGKVMDVTQHSQYSRIVSWWKMGDDPDAASGTGAIKDSVGSNHGTPFGTIEIVTPTGLGSTQTSLFDRKVNASTAVSGVIDFRRPTGSVTKHIIANKFSAPGGPETAGLFANNYESNEYSIYNTLNYRNSTVRNTLDKLSEEQSDQFGYRSDSTTQASIHATNRNALRRTGSLGKEVNFDNNFIQHPIPQSDYQYS